MQEMDINEHYLAAILQVFSDSQQTKTDWNE